MDVSGGVTMSSEPQSPDLRETKALVEALQRKIDYLEGRVDELEDDKAKLQTKVREFELELSERGE